jgi:Tfp pilus assembly pilus retraction ATPase PilT
MTSSLHHWLTQAHALGASDLHLSAGVPPMARVHGELQALQSEAVCSEQLSSQLHHALPDWSQKQDHD